MTIFAVACAGMFPMLHLGRPWLFYWLLPYPNTMTVQPQFRSPLVWDVFAVSTYATVSLLFWYLGMIPDLATAARSSRENASRMAFYGVLSLGMARRVAALALCTRPRRCCLAGLATPLVLSVHTVVSFDFTIAILPGWHSTIFPPYFVAGRDLFRIRDGAGARDSASATVYRSAEPDHRTSPQQLRQVDAGHGPDSGLHLRDRAVHRLVQRQSDSRCTRCTTGHSDRLPGPIGWSSPATSLSRKLLWFKKVRMNPQELFGVSHGGAVRYVAGALHDHRHQPASRLSAVVLDSTSSPRSGTTTRCTDRSVSSSHLFALFVRFLPMISMYEVRELAAVLEAGRRQREMSGTGLLRCSGGIRRSGTTGGRGARVARARASARWRRTRLTRLKSSKRSCNNSIRCRPLIVLTADPRHGHCLDHAILHCRHRLSHQRRRTAAQ